MRVTKLLALAVLAVVAAACNGNSPSAPDDPMVAADRATAQAGANSVAKEGGSPCRNITEVQLRIVRGAGDSPDARTSDVAAVYLIDGGPTRCQIAPTWTSNPRGRIILSRNPFAVTVVGRAVTVTAEAPNGVRGRLRVQ